MRDQLTVAIKLVFNGFFAIVFSLVYFRLDKDQTSIQDRTGLLFFLSMNQAFGAVISTAQVIPRQLVVVNRERANRLYAVFPFYLSSLITILPIEAIPQLVYNAIVFFMTNLSGSFWIFFGLMLLENVVGIALGMALSALFKNVQMASQVAPAVVILFLIFSGFLINEDSVPVYFVWLMEISFIRYTFKALVRNEFEGTTLSCDDAVDPTSCISDGAEVLKALGFDEDDLILKCVLLLIGLFVALNVVAMGILLARRPKFLALEKSGKAGKSVAAETQVASSKEGA
jgi:ABC-type multidrug transport system permease subunit